MGNLGYIIGGPRGLNMGGRKGIICMRKMVTKNDASDATKNKNVPEDEEVHS